MAAGPVTALKVNIFDVTRSGTVTITATDDADDTAVSKYSARNNPPFDLVQEVFAKVLKNVKTQAAVQLMIDAQGYIVRDPSFPIPGTNPPQSTIAAVAAPMTMKAATSGGSGAKKAAKGAATAERAPKPKAARKTSKKRGR
jgi:hypothetical protein